MLRVTASVVVTAVLLPFVASQAQKATCLSGYQWSYNSDNVSPCDIAASLAGVCVGGAFTLAPLDSGFVYLGPSSSNANSCRCSSVYYSLLSACANCQSRNYVHWSTYNANCTTVFSQVFNNPIPVGTKVPAYAYQDVQTSDNFNVTLAQNTRGTESTRAPSSSSSAAPSATSTASKSKTNVGAIVGGVVGGVVGAILLAALIFWLLNRRRKAKPKISKPISNSTYEPVHQTPSMGYAPNAPSSFTMSPSPTNLSHLPNTMSPPPGAIYDPNDPTTFPVAEHTTGTTSYNYPQTSTPDPLMQQNYMHPTYTGSTHTGGRPHYTGAPEV